MADKVEELTKAMIEKGGVLSQLYFDVHGPDKGAVEGILVELSDRISKTKGVVYAVGDINRAMDMGDGKFSAAARIIILTDNFTILAKICAFYSPLGIEILKPMEVRMSIQDAQQLLFDNSQVTYTFSKELIEKTMTPAERKELMKKLTARAELGKKLIEEGSKASVDTKEPTERKD